MFPNPHDALPLPPCPNLEQYKKLAKELVHACKSGDPHAFKSWAERWIRTLVRLSDLTITRHLPVRVETWIDEVGEFARRELSGPDAASAKCGLARAQLVIARSHGFESWPKFSRHLERLAATDSSVSQFELAVNAIVSGDIATVRRLLEENPELIREHSSRAHQATLLHYVSANGVEGYRQKTPANIVQIANVLLQAGAEVNANAHIYGESTALELAATSIHPLRTGVQNDLLESLLDHGATVADDAGRRLIRACLANGRHDAARYLSGRGAPLDLEGAAGVGRFDLVKTFFNRDDTLKSPANSKQLQRGFLWACEFGHDDVVKFLLDKGANIRDKSDGGQTALHWAIVGGCASTIKLLLARGAPLEETNAYGGTALGQALWSFFHRYPKIDDVPIFETLLAAGANIEEGTIAWLENQEGRSLSEKKEIDQLLRRYGAKT